MKEKAVIIDLDGTLCNIEHRLHHIKKAKPDWKSFYAGIPQDSLNTWCKELIDVCDVQHYIFLVTGRELTKQVRNDTTEWLSKNGIVYNELLGRDKGDYRPDDVLKKEIYKKFIEDEYDVVFIVDDRTRVVEMWRSLGLPCLQCANWEELK